ncbi:MAG TPA: LysM peptidoglycan-binding domain-containing protein [Vicinamibacteria bacterium]|nr:LysM peptidoglycan-binding domain-containing protein [Vicinamibacteria bacterium]
MGLFDNKSGAGVATPPGQDQQLATLKAKYQSVLNAIQQQGVRVHNVHVQDGKLLIRGEAPSEDVKNKIWDQIRLVSPDPQDLIADITVAPGGATSAQAKPSAGSRTYTVKPGDTLSKISKDHYGNANAYMKIFEANRDKLTDPDKIKPGQVLNIP